MIINLLNILEERFKSAPDKEKELIMGLLEYYYKETNKIICKKKIEIKSKGFEKE